MTKNTFLTELEIILDEARIGTLTTVDTEGYPRQRWMTPTILKDRGGTLYALTARHFEKVRHIENNPKVEWNIQTRLLDKIVTLRGQVNLIDNSMLKTEVLEAIGPRLHVFWRINTDPSSMIILETIIESGSIFYPLKGIRQKADFRSETGDE